MDWIQKWFFKKCKRKYFDSGFVPGEWNSEHLQWARGTIREISTIYIWRYIHNQNFTENDMFDIEDTEFTKGNDAMIEHFLDMMGHR